MKKAEKTIDTACVYLNDLRSVAIKYADSVIKVRDKYNEVFGYVAYTVNNLKKIDWNDFSDEEKIATQNAILLVGLLYKMCQISLVNKATNEGDMNTINHSAIDESMNNAELVLSNLCCD